MPPEIRDAFRCDYCGTLAPLERGITYYEPVDEITGEAGEQIRLWVAATYCSPYCGRTAVSRSGAGRG